MRQAVTSVQPTIDRPPAPDLSPRAARLVSLDAFRGLTMAAMVVVNNPGDWNHVYAPLQHAEWHGWTSTDLIFPFFLFIVGISITLSRRRDTGQILRRAAVLFALGLLLNGFPFFRLDTWRIPGVLQRIAFCYLAAAAMFRLTAGVSDSKQAFRLGLWIAGLIGGYWIVMTQIGTPWAARGDLSPEGNLGAVLLTV